MARDPQYLAFVRLVEKVSRAGGPMTVEEERAGNASSMTSIPSQPVAHELDVTVGGRPARLYHPRPGTTLPGLVYLHGGGFYLGSVRAWQPTVRELVRASGCAFISVDYRLAPEDPFPAGVTDAVTATSDVLDRAAEFGIDRARVGVAGDSAGANLAAVTAVELADRLALQLLIYGVFDLSVEVSLPPDPDGVNLPATDWSLIRDRYLGGADRTDPRASPMKVADLSGLPPAVIAAAEYDRGRTQSEQYAQRLREAGVPVTYVAGTGLDHAYASWTTFARRPAEAVAEIGAGVRAAFGPASAGSSV